MRESSSAWVSPLPRTLRSLVMVRSRFGPLSLALMFLLILASMVTALIYVPWQQSVSGRGEVTVFTPDQRAQDLDAPIPGRIVKWLAKEGQAVKKGQLLCVLEDLESRFLDPRQPALLRAQIAAVRGRRSAVLARLGVLEEQAGALGQSREAAIPGARQKVLQAGDRATMARQGVRAAQQTLATARLQRERIARLHAGGLRSTRDLELADLDRVRAETDLARARAQQEVARRDIRAAQLDQDKVTADTAVSLVSVQATAQQARESLASIDAELLKLQADLNNLERRTEQRKVYAPATGTLVRIHKAGKAETVKAGEPLALLMPQTRDIAVELMVSSFDAPLLEPGRPVRLMFDGFPAVPFTGWPWAAVGTFSGRVAVVDMVDDGTGKYRVLVRPERTVVGGTWPPSDRLRPGTRTTGWILLDEVPLYYEIWRRLNAFPATVEVTRPADKDAKADKPDKKPKPVIKK